MYTEVWEVMSINVHRGMGSDIHNVHRGMGSDVHKCTEVWEVIFILYRGMGSDVHKCTQRYGKGYSYCT